jgi:hypothetical protein
MLDVKQCEVARGTEMVKGPQGQKRPADTVANAIRVAKILTGEIEEDTGSDDGKDKAAQQLGKKGGAARRDKLSPERRTEIARKAASARWRRIREDGLRANN